MMVLQEVAGAEAVDDMVTTIEMMDTMEVAEVVDILPLEGIEKVVMNTRHGFSRDVLLQDLMGGPSTRHLVGKNTITTPTLTKHSGMFPAIGKIRNECCNEHRKRLFCCCRF